MHFDDPYFDDELEDGPDRDAAGRVPQLRICRDDLTRIQCYIDCCNAEISGMAHLKIGEDALLIHDPVLLEQEVTGASTDIDPEALGTAVAEIAAGGGDPSTFVVWWHSHYTMNTFWSGTDEATIEMLGGYSDILVSIVGNLDGDWKARIDIFKPVRITADVKLDIIDVLPDGLETEIKVEIEAKVRRKVFRHKPRQASFGCMYPATWDGHWDEDLFWPTAEPTNQQPEQEEERGILETT